MTLVRMAVSAAGIDMRSPDYTLWWGVAGLLLPVFFVSLLVVMVRMGTRGGRARLPVNSRGAVTLVGHLLRGDLSLTEDRLHAPSCHGQFVLAGGQVRWVFDRRGGWTAPAGVLIVHGVQPGLEGPFSAAVDFEIGGAGEWSGRWRLVLGGVEPQDRGLDAKVRARRRADAALVRQLAAVMIAQGAIDARARSTR